MKKIFYGTIMLALPLMLGLAACDDDTINIPVEPLPEYPSIEEQQAQDWVVSQKTACIFQDASSNPDLMLALNTRFPNQTASPADADVIIFGPESKIDPNAFDAAVGKGAILAIVDPIQVMDEETKKMFEEEMPGVDFTHTKLFAFNTQGYTFNMLVDEEFDGKYNEDMVVSPKEDIEKSDNYGKEHPERETGRQWLYDNSYEHNLNYFHERIDPFVDFVDDVFENEVNKAKAATRATGSKYTSDIIQLNIDDCAFHEYNIPIALNYIITHDVWHWQSIAYNYRRDKTGSISVRVWTNASYMFGINGSENAGDYYVVKTELIHHGKSLWQVASEKGGFLNSGRCRIYAYWLDNLDVHYELVDAVGKSIPTNDYKYYRTPIPENDIISKGFEWTLNGVMDNNSGNNSNSTFALNLNSNTVFDAGGLQYSFKSDTPTHSYSYWGKVKMTDDDYEDDVATNNNFPVETHDETSIKSAWTWYVPSNEALGVGDKLNGAFGIKISVKPRYASWFHWRAALEYDSNKQTYDVPLNTHIIQIAPPNRQPWGILSLENKKPGHYIKDIHIHKEKDYKEKEYRYPVFTDYENEYREGDNARFSLAEGTYVLVFTDFENGYGDLVEKTITIKQGTDALSTTTIVTLE